MSIHLAALQVPFVKANPPLGAGVNVVGTVNVFEAARRHGLPTPIAYASTAAVYDDRGDRDPRHCTESSRSPTRARAASTGPTRAWPAWASVPTSSSAPAGTRASLPARRRDGGGGARQPYEIAFGGRTEMHYAPDVARGFIAAARSKPTKGGRLRLPRHAGVHIPRSWPRSRPRFPRQPGRSRSTTCRCRSRRSSRRAARRRGDAARRRRPRDDRALPRRCPRSLTLPGSTCAASSSAGDGSASWASAARRHTRRCSAR